MKRYIVYGGFLLLLVLACDKPDIRLNNPNDTLRPAAEFMRNNYAYSLFYAAIEKAGLTDELNGPGPFTVWAPTDVAFNRLGIQRPADFDRFSVDSLRQLVRYHVQPGMLAVEDIPENTVNNRYTSVSGTDVWLARVNTSGQENGTPMIRPFINGVLIGQWTNRANSNEHFGRHNIRLANGMFHEINDILKYDGISVRDWLEKQGNYEVLIAGLKRFGYWDLLMDDRQWTIMAPVDSLFEQQGMTVENVAALDTTRYGKRLFGVYVFPARFFISDLRLFRYTLRVGSTSIPLMIYTPIIGDEQFSNGINVTTSGLFMNRTYPESPWEGFPYQTPVDLNNNNGTAWSHSNWLVTNGTIHELGGVVLVPGQTVNE